MQLDVPPEAVEPVKRALCDEIRTLQRVIADSNPAHPNTAAWVEEFHALRAVLHQIADHTE